MLHVLFIDGLSMSAELSLDRIAFHGGTNLHLSWGSPRYSEDLDFLVSRDFAGRIRKIMAKIETRMQRVAAAHDPDLRIEIRDKTKDRNALLNYRVAMSRPGIIGQAMVKAEFWQVEADYFKKYNSKFVTQKAGVATFDKPLITLTPPMPAASLEAAFADKIVALSLRPHLKWRDLFDLWWIDKQIGANVVEHVDAVKHHASGYSGASLQDGIERFLARDPDDVLSTADPDLKRWLPKPLWDGLWPDEVRSMVAHARNLAEELGAILDKTPEGGSLDETTREDDGADFCL